MQRENPARPPPKIMAAAASPVGGGSTAIQCPVQGLSGSNAGGDVGAAPLDDGAPGELGLDMAQQ